MKHIVIEYSKSARKFLADNGEILSFEDANTLLAKAARKQRESSFATKKTTLM